jgi:hypothetical protein
VTKPTIPEVLPLFVAYHQKPENGAWGYSLHGVLADGNIGDENVRYAIEDAEQLGDMDAKKLGEILLSMSKTQRRKIRYAVHEFEWQAAQQKSEGRL